MNSFHKGDDNIIESMKGTYHQFVSQQNILNSNKMLKRNEESDVLQQVQQTATQSMRPLQFQKLQKIHGFVATLQERNPTKPLHTNSVGILCKKEEFSIKIKSNINIRKRKYLLQQ
jgi:hypothetical protein